MKVALTRLIENPVDAIEEAASNCYDSIPTGGKIMNHCYQSGHHSVLEFAHFTFHIEGVSRALTHQLVRHRMASYAQRSQRYCEEDGFNFVVPPSIKPGSEAWDAYFDLMEQIEETYDTLKNECHIPPEDARMVLPNACYTTIEVSMNGRELIHFCNERMCSRAQWEIRELANLMAAAVKEHDEQCAQFAKYLVPKCEAKGLEYAICPEAKPCKERHHPRLKDIFKKLSVDNN